MLAELARAVRERRVSAAELVQRSLDRIERLDPTLNAVTMSVRERALERARELDERGADGPLAGLPLLVKDNTDVEGMVTTFGSRTMLERPAAAASEVSVRADGERRRGDRRPDEPSRVRVPGVHDNDVFGPTPQPLGGRLVAGGLERRLGGGDRGRSRADRDGDGRRRLDPHRRPAFCGLVGLKPTNGLLGRRPIPSWIDFSTQGPLATTVEDATLLLEVMRGPVAGRSDRRAVVAPTATGCPPA